MKRLIGTVVVLVAACLMTSVASAGNPWHHGHHAGHYAPAPHHAYRHNVPAYNPGCHPQQNFYRPPVVYGYRAPIYQPPYYGPPVRSGFSYYGPNFGVSVGY